MSLSRNLAKVIVDKNVDASIVISLLTKYNLLSLLSSIVEAIKEIEALRVRGETIMIESPFDINKKSLTAIRNIIGNTKAPHEIRINKKILAGFKARFEGRLYDGSVERVLSELISHQN